MMRRPRSFLVFKPTLRRWPGPVIATVSHLTFPKSFRDEAIVKYLRSEQRPPSANNHVDAMNMNAHANIEAF